MSKLTIFTGAIFLTIGISMLLSLPVYLLWNSCLVGAIDGVKEITFPQSLGILILFSFLFKPSVSSK